MENELFYTEKVTEHITRIVLPGEVFAYLVEGKERAVLIDTGCGIGDLKGFVDSLTDKPYIVLLSHGHLDHAPGAVQFEEVYMSVLDKDILSVHGNPERRYNFSKGIDGAKNYTFEDLLLPDNASRYHDLKDGDRFELGGYTIEAVFCPGHTDGSMTFLMEQERILLTGDACNPRTLLLSQKLGLASYERSLKTLKSKVDGRYDRVLVSHGIGQVASRSMIEDNLQVIADIRAGKAENTPFSLGDRSGMFLAMKPGRVNEYGEVVANIAYDPARINE